MRDIMHEIINFRISLNFHVAVVQANIKFMNKYKLHLGKWLFPSTRKDGERLHLTCSKVKAVWVCCICIIQWEDRLYVDKAKIIFFFFFSTVSMVEGLRLIMADPVTKD